MEDKDGGAAGKEDASEDGMEPVLQWALFVTKP